MAKNRSACPSPCRLSSSTSLRCRACRTPSRFSTQLWQITNSIMKTRKLGNSDMAITPVGFGAWAIGGGDWQFGWGDQDEKDSIAAIHRALELGINWIDTAAVYGLGHSEEVV